jgi:hypothetical protein
MSERPSSKKMEPAKYATLLQQLHDKILAQLNAAHTKKVDELIAKMSSVQLS